MRDETGVWLEPMLDEADKRGIATTPLLYPASIPAAEADNEIGDWLAKHPVPGVEHRATDWVRFGQLLRHELGWDDTYPAFPDFPETRDVP
jgi:hypothetical protein